MTPGPRRLTLFVCTVIVVMLMTAACTSHPLSKAAESSARMDSTTTSTSSKTATTIPTTTSAPITTSIPTPTSISTTTSIPITTTTTPSQSAVQAPPAPVATGQSIASTSCPTEAFCVAVGQEEAPTVGTNGLIEMWNGTTWSVLPAPGVPSDGYGWNELLSVACPTTDFCVGVGSYESRTVGTAGLIDVWNGTTWSTVADPGVPSDGWGSNQLSSVTCSSPSSCTADGEYESRTVGTGGLVDVWNGTSWTDHSSS